MGLSFPQMDDIEYGYMSPIGPVSITACRTAVTSLRLVSYNDVRRSLNVFVETNDHIMQTIQWLESYFSGSLPVTMPPLAPRGTPFQLRVWHELLSIPYGQTVTYGQLARRIGCGSARAVGQAVGHNPIAILIPCHRVVAADGIGGYAYGTSFKRRLLELEHNNTKAGS